MNIPKLPRGTIKSLAEALDEAEGWRGTLIGNPDPEPLKEFDANIRRMRDALKAVRDQQRALRQAGVLV